MGFTYLLPESNKTALDGMKDHFSHLFVQNNINCSDSEHIIVYEEGLNKMFGSSSRGYMICRWMGAPNVSVLDGGYQGVLKLDAAKQKQLKAVIKNEDSTKGDVTFTFDDRWMSGYEDVMDVISGKRK